MKPFKFQLEAVLRHRRHIEEQLQRNVAELRNQLSEMKRHLRELAEQSNCAAREIRQHLIGTIDPNYLSAHYRFTAANEKKAAQLTQNINTQQQQIDDAQTRLMNAVKQRKMIEKLKDRQRERWLADVAQKEFLQADELSTRLAFEASAETE